MLYTTTWRGAARSAQVCVQMRPSLLGVDGPQDVPGGVSQVVFGAVATKVGVDVLQGVVQHLLDGLTTKPIFWPIFDCTLVVRLGDTSQANWRNQVVPVPVCVVATD